MSRSSWLKGTLLAAALVLGLAAKRSAAQTVVVGPRRRTVPLRRPSLFTRRRPFPTMPRPLLFLITRPGRFQLRGAGRFLLRRSAVGLLLRRGAVGQLLHPRTDRCDDRPPRPAAAPPGRQNSLLRLGARCDLRPGGRRRGAERRGLLQSGLPLSLRPVDPRTPTPRQWRAVGGCLAGGGKGQPVPAGHIRRQGICPFGELTVQRSCHGWRVAHPCGSDPRRMPIWLRWLSDSWRKWISCAPKWPRLRRENLQLRQQAGYWQSRHADAVRRIAAVGTGKSSNSAVRSASCKPNSLDAAPRSNPAATAPMNWTTPPTPSPSVHADDNPVSPLPDAAITATCPRGSSSLTCPKQNNICPSCGQPLKACGSEDSEQLEIEITRLSPRDPSTAVSADLCLSGAAHLSRRRQQPS